MSQKNEFYDVLHDYLSKSPEEVITFIKNNQLPVPETGPDYFKKEVQDVNGAFSSTTVKRRKFILKVKEIYVED